MELVAVGLLTGVVGGGVAWVALEIRRLTATLRALTAPDAPAPPVVEATRAYLPHRPSVEPDHSAVALADDDDLWSRKLRRQADDA